MTWVARKPSRSIDKRGHNGFAAEQQTVCPPGFLSAQHVIWVMFRFLDSPVPPTVTRAEKAQSSQRLLLSKSMRLTYPNRDEASRRVENAVAQSGTCTCHVPISAFHSRATRPTLTWTVTRATATTFPGYFLRIFW